MNLSTTLLLSGYSLAIVAASLLGGWLPTLVRMTHTRTQLVISFVAGLMLGVAVYHLLPHALLELSSLDAGSDAIETTAWWMMLGIMSMLVLLRLFNPHRHDFSGDEAGADQAQNPGMHGADIRNPGIHPMSWVGVTLGLGLHTLTEVVTLGASVSSELPHCLGSLPMDCLTSSDDGPADSVADGMIWAGLATFLAIFLHKPLDALSVTSLMQAGGWQYRARVLANICFALLWPLGMLLFSLGMYLLGPDQAQAMGRALAFSAGAFLCIALCDLLPEVQHHRHDRIKLTLFFLLGIGVAYGLRQVEEDLGGHHHGGELNWPAASMHEQTGGDDPHRSPNTVNP